MRSTQGYQKQKRFWDLYSFFYDSINFSIPYQKLMNLLVDELEIKSGQKILDFGCGTGNWERVIGKRNLKNVAVTAIDYSDSMLARAKKKCINWNYIHFQKIDLNKKLPYENNHFDSIVGNNVIYAVSKQKLTADELYRVLKPGGKIVISDPKPNAQIKLIVAEHLKEVSEMPIMKRIWNYIKFVITMPIAGLPPIMLSVFVINRRQQKGFYHYSEKDDIEKMFSKFKEITIKSVYADQNWLIEGYKEK